MYRLAVALLLAAAAAPAYAQYSPAADPAIAELERELQRTLRANGAASRHAVLVVSLDRGDTLVSLNADLPLTPASNMKLYSTAAALYYLGPEYRYHTYLLAAGDLREGVLEGDLILYGTGDPSISRRLHATTTAAFRALADSLAARGITEIRGDLVGDGSYFDAQWTGDGWLPHDRLAWYGPPVGALSYAENLVSVRVLPAARAGDAARIVTDPATLGLAVQNRVRTVARGATRVSVRHGDAALVVEGQIRRGGGAVTYNLPVVDPANFAVAGFHEVLRERGIRVHGVVRSHYDPIRSTAPFGPGTGVGVARPARARVAAIHASAPLLELATVTNHVSHNLFAEALLKTAGRVALGEGSFAAGARVVVHFLEREVGVDTRPLAVHDGSGLSRDNLLTARATVALLDFMARSEVADAFLRSLPEAGSENGLRRMHGTRAAGNVRAKTGTLNGVSSLSGYVTTADGERLAFSIMANQVATRATAKRTEDAVAVRLAGFRRSAALAGWSTAAPEPAGATVP